MIITQRRISVGISSQFETKSCPQYKILYQLLKFHANFKKVLSTIFKIHSIEFLLYNKHSSCLINEI